VIARYLVVAGRIRQELAALERVVTRVERAAHTLGQLTEYQDLLLDATALNLHDFYGGLERILLYIASTIDGSVPSGPEWHRDLLRQMQMTLPQLRPPVVLPETGTLLDEYMRFRHVVRNVYAFDFELERIAPLVQRLRPCFTRVQNELEGFAAWLEQLAQADND
jgi:hypothetical protein